MEFVRTERFLRAYKQLDRGDRNRVDQALLRFSLDPSYPSLHVEKITGNIWSFRASRSLRCTFEWDGDLIELFHAESVLLRNVGYHDVYRSP